MALKLYTASSETKGKSAETRIILLTVSAILAIIFDGKKKKPKKRKSFLERTHKNYINAGGLVDSYSAYRKKKQFEQTGIMPESDGLTIEKAEIIDIDF